MILCGEKVISLFYTAPSSKIIFDFIFVWGLRRWWFTIVLNLSETLPIFAGSCEVAYSALRPAGDISYLLMSDIELSNFLFIVFLQLEPILYLLIALSGRIINILPVCCYVGCTFTESIYMAVFMVISLINVNWDLKKSNNP